MDNTAFLVVSIQLSRENVPLDCLSSGIHLICMSCSSGGPADLSMDGSPIGCHASGCQKTACTNVQVLQKVHSKSARNIAHHCLLYLNTTDVAHWTWMVCFTLRFDPLAMTVYKISPIKFLSKHFKKHIFWWPPLDILFTISIFATTWEISLFRLLVDWLVRSLVRLE